MILPILSPIGRDEAQRRAAEELLQPRYEKESLVDRAYRAVQQFVGDLLDSAPGGSAGGVIAAVLIALIIGGLILMLTWQLRRTTRGRAAAQGALFGAKAMTAAEHRRAAEVLAEQGDWTQAVRERLRAVARDLEERAVIDEQPGRTADELAAEAGRMLPAFAVELTASAYIFDEVTYGDVPGTPDAYGVLRDLDERLRVARPVPLGAGS